MKYIVITKRHIIAAAAALAIAAAGIGGGLCLYRYQNKVAQTFAQDENAGRRIVEAELPAEDDGSWGDKVRSFLKGEAKPEELLKDASGIFEDQESGPEAEYEIQEPSVPPEESASPAPADPTPSPEAETEATALPEEIKIEKQKITGNMEIKNETEYNVDLASFVNEPMPFPIEGGEAPEVLIVHTHTTECYGTGARSTDDGKNMIAIGKLIAQQIEAHGIKVVHDTTVHDYPSYKSAYTRALSTIKANLEKYSSIKVVLDVHRDAIVRSDGTHVAVSAQVNGQKSAQVMIVAGTNASGLNHPNWKSNLNFASKIQNTANIKYPELMRPLNLREERFNQHMTKGSLILEIGSTGNSLEEAKTAGTMIGDVIGEVLKSG